MKNYPSPYQKRVLWNALTGLAIVIIGAIIVGFIWLAGKVLGFLQPVLVPLAFAGIVAYLLDPIVTWFQTKKKLSRLKSVLIVFMASVLLAVLASLTVIPPLVGQVGELVSGRHEIGKNVITKLEEFKDNKMVKDLAVWATTAVDPETGDAIKPLTSQVSPVVNPEAEQIIKQPISKQHSEATFSDSRIGYYITRNTSKISEAAISILKGGTNVILGGSSHIFGLLGYVIGFIMVPIYLYYFLKESSSIKSTWHDYIPLKASKFKTEVVSSLAEINSYLIAFFRGQVLVALIDGLLVGIALTIFQLPHGLVIGLFLGVLGVVPFIGNILCMVPACIIAFIHFSSKTPNHQWLGDSPLAYVGAVILIFLVVQQINSLVTAPKIVGESVGLHPMTVIFSMLFWSLLLGGFLGALLAVPMTAAIKVLFRRYIWERKISEHLPSKEDTSAMLNEPLA